MEVDRAQLIREGVVYCEQVKTLLADRTGPDSNTVAGSSSAGTRQAKSWVEQDRNLSAKLLCFLRLRNLWSAGWRHRHQNQV